MSQNKGLNPEMARGKANELSGHLGTIDHLISELGSTHRAALHPQSYGIDAGERTIAPWSVGSVLGAKGDLAAARSAAADLIRRIHEEVGTQVVTSSNGVSLASMFLTKNSGKASQDEIDDMIELALLVANGYAITEEEREQLADFLAKFGKDQNAMSQLFQSLGAENTSFLLLSLSDLVNTDPNASQEYKDLNAELLLLSNALRDGLAVASEKWTTDEAEAFLGDDPFESVTTVAGLSFLFNDPENPMGANLTVVLAEQIDQWERDPKHDNPTFAELGLVPESTIYRLAALEGGMLDGGSAQDLAGRVFETLGQYPDQALDFLAPEGDDKLGSDRVDYWYGERDWANLDQWEGPGALWYGATNSTDDAGTLDGVDNVANARNALLTSEIINALAKNESFETNALGNIVNVSETAASAFAGAIAINLADISDYMVQSDATSFEGSGALALVGFGDDVTHAIPKLSQEDLAKVISQIIGLDGSGDSTGFAHPDAAQIIYNTATDMQTMYYLAGVGDPALLEDAAQRSMFLQGMLDGTSMGGSEDLAARHDQASDAAIDGVMEVVKVIPFGSLASKAIQGGLGLVLNEAVTLGSIEKQIISKEVGININKLEELWKESQHNSSSVANLLEGHKETLALQYQLNLGGMLYDAVGSQVLNEYGDPIPGPPEPRPKENAEDFQDRATDWWDRYKLQLGDAAGFSAESLPNNYVNTVEAYSSWSQH